MYANNIPLWEYIDFVQKMTKLLSDIKKYEEKTADSSLARFIEAVIDRISIGEQNKFKYTKEELYLVDSEPDFKQIECEKIINCYTIIFDVLIEDGKNGLEDLFEALTIFHLRECHIKNYFNLENEKKQKRSEMLFFLAHLNKSVRERNLSKDEMQVCASIMARILSNPCIAPVCVESAENPDEINESLEYIRSNEVALEAVRLFLEQLDCEQNPYDELNELYEMIGHYRVLEDFEMAAYCEEVAKEYENALQALNECINASWSNIGNHRIINNKL